VNEVKYLKASKKEGWKWGHHHKGFLSLSIFGGNFFNGNVR
jgi:hypothetical protein